MTTSVWQGRGRRLQLHEVGPRDGLQSEAVFVPTADKIAWIDALSDAGFAKIEVTAFVSPTAIPALSDASEVMAGIRRVPGVRYAALVPNVRGAERALAAEVDELNLVMSATESHNQSNLRMSREQSFAALRAVAGVAEAARRPVQVSLSCAFGCPIEGEVPAATVLDWCARHLETLGAAGLTLCDTTGMAHPGQVHALVTAFLARWPDTPLTLHFHDTRAMGLANVLAALDAGAVAFDASAGGLGGCPYAPGATGNVCSEELVHALDCMGWDTGVDLDRLLAAAARLPALVGHDVPSAILKAGHRLARRARSAAAPATPSCAPSPAAEGLSATPPRGRPSPASALPCAPAAARQAP